MRQRPAAGGCAEGRRRWPTLTACDTIEGDRRGRVRAHVARQRRPWDVDQLESIEHTGMVRVRGASRRERRTIIANEQVFKKA